MNRTLIGKEFHARSPAMEKALSLRVGSSGGVCAPSQRNYFNFQVKMCISFNRQLSLEFFC